MDSVYIRGVQNIDFGQAFSNEDNCILSIWHHIKNGSTHIELIFQSAYYY